MIFAGDVRLEGAVVVRKLGEAHRSSFGNLPECGEPSIGMVRRHHASTIRATSPQVAGPEARTMELFEVCLGKVELEGIGRPDMPPRFHRRQVRHRSIRHEKAELWRAAIPRRHVDIHRHPLTSHWSDEWHGPHDDYGPSQRHRSLGPPAAIQQSAASEKKNCENNQEDGSHTGSFLFRKSSTQSEHVRYAQPRPIVCSARVEV